jgi:hypothetical protein
MQLGRESGATRGSFFARYNGSNWETQKQIPNAYSAVGPALCSFGGKLVAAWKDVFDQNLYFATYSGSKWSAQSQIAGVGSSVGPSLATYGGKLYAVWKGEGSDQGLYYAYYDGTRWSGQTPGSTQTQIPGNVGNVGDTFHQIPGRLTTISSSGEGPAWGLNSAGEIFQLLRDFSGFTQVAGKLDSITVGGSGDGFVWGLAA